MENCNREVLDIILKLNEGMTAGMDGKGYHDYWVENFEDFYLEFILHHCYVLFK